MLQNLISKMAADIFFKLWMMLAMALTFFLVLKGAGILGNKPKESYLKDGEVF